MGQVSKYRVGVNAGPVHVSRRVGGKKKTGPLTAITVWFIVKPLELIFRGGAHVLGKKRTRSAPGWTTRPVSPVPTRGYFAPPAAQPGWYDTAWGPLYWNGRNWYAQDGRAIF